MIIPKELSETMNGCIHVVNFVKTSALNSRIVSLLRGGVAMGTERQSLLFQTSVRWVHGAKFCKTLRTLS